LLRVRHDACQRDVAVRDNHFDRASRDHAIPRQRIQGGLSDGPAGLVPAIDRFDLELIGQATHAGNGMSDPLGQPGFTAVAHVTLQGHDAMGDTHANSSTVERVELQGFEDPILQLTIDGRRRIQEAVHAVPDRIRCASARAIGSGGFWADSARNDLEDRLRPGNPQRRWG
jgi:hypothetical protein